MVNGWYDNKAGLVDYTQPSTQPKIVVKKRGKVDINSLSFDDLKEIHAEVSLRLEEYCKHTEDVKKLMKDQIIGTVKYLTLVKVRMSQIASKEQSLHMLYLDKLEKSASESTKLVAEIAQKLDKKDKIIVEKINEEKALKSRIAELQGALSRLKTNKVRRK